MESKSEEINSKLNNLNFDKIRIEFLTRKLELLNEQSSGTRCPSCNTQLYINVKVEGEICNA